MSDHERSLENDSSSSSDVEKGEGINEKEEGKNDPAPTRIAPAQVPSGNVQEKRSDINNEGDQPQHANIKDWDGPDDPENPQNWKLSVRFYHAITPAFFGFAV